MPQDITKIDKNFAVKARIDKPDAVFYDVMSEPFRIYGVTHDGSSFHRLPEAVAQTVSDRVGVLSGHTAGGRVRFQTNSTYVALHAQLPTIGKMPHFALTGSAGFDLYADGRFVKTFVPPFKVTDGYEGVIELGDAQMREITINFPMYSSVSNLYIGLCEKAQVAAPRPYRYEKPVVYYGSSITQGGCASRPGNAYPAILSRRLDCDYVNLGFSGSGRAEREIADYIAGLSMSLFVYDYDHNAPDVKYLEATHEKMFRTVREKNPKLPILILSRPRYSLSEVERQRLGVIRRTYANAMAAGDKNVYLMEGPELMAMVENEGTVDGTHPNDLGFASMAKALEPLIASILEKESII